MSTVLCLLAPAQDGLRALAERGDVKKSPREIEMRVALIDDDNALIVYDAVSAPGPDADGLDNSLERPKAFLAYWYNYQTRELFVFGRRLYDRKDVGRALRNLQRDLAADPIALLELDPDLERALAQAKRDAEDPAKWRPVGGMIFEALAGLVGNEGAVADAPGGGGFDPDLDPEAAACPPETSGSGPRRIVLRGPQAGTGPKGPVRSILQIIGCGGGCGWCDRGGWITLEEVCPPCTKCCPYPPGCCDPSQCDPETGWCIQTCCRSNNFCIPLTSSCCDYTACSSNQHCCHAPDPNHSKCCPQTPVPTTCCGTNPIYCCQPNETCCNGQCGLKGACCDFVSGACIETTQGCCIQQSKTYLGNGTTCTPGDLCRPKCENCHSVNDVFYECGHYTRNPLEPCDQTHCIVDTLQSATCDSFPYRLGPPKCDTKDTGIPGEVMQILYELPIPMSCNTSSPGGYHDWVSIYSGCGTTCAPNPFGPWRVRCDSGPCGGAPDPNFPPQPRGTKKACGACP